MNRAFHEAIERQRERRSLPASVEASFRLWSEQDRARVCAMAGHTLRRDGAPAADWQPWLALAAWGFLLQDNASLARSLALVSFVYPEIAKRLPTSVPVPRNVDRHALTHVLGLSTAGEPPEVPSPERLEFVRQGFDSLDPDDCYAVIAASTTNGDWEACRAAFDQLADFAAEGGATEPWHAELNPGYEPIPSALAAVARSKGFDLASLSDEARSWLWPAVESEPGILPAVWPIPDEGQG